MTIKTYTKNHEYEMTHRAFSHFRLYYIYTDSLLLWSDHRSFRTSTSLPVVYSYSTSH